MIQKKLRILITSMFAIKTSRFFCIDYISSKRLKQEQKTKLLYKHDESKLKNVQMNFKAVSPVFFAQRLPLQQSTKIIMKSKDANALQNSYIRLSIPVKSNQQIKGSLLRFSSNQVRIGKILQCMDSIAGIVGYRHCFGSLTDYNPFILVTGCVDSINLFQPITIQNDIIMEGYINQVGKTSMQIQINLFQQNILKSNALFTMISRNALDHSKGYNCPQLVIEHLAEPELQKAKIRKQQAKMNILRRKKQMAQSYKLIPPSAQDAKIIHHIFLNSNYKSPSEKQIDIQSTVVVNTHLMHVQERNIHNKIFGGYLLRKMIETGWVSACQFANSDQLRAEDLTNIYFRNPVEIGCQLKIVSRVSYTHQNIIVVTIQAWTRTFGEFSEQKNCCSLHMFLRSETKQNKVVPLSYQNGIHYLTGRNALKQILPNI